MADSANLFSNLGGLVTNAVPRATRLSDNNELVSRVSRDLAGV